MKETGWKLHCVKTHLSDTSALAHLSTAKFPLSDLEGRGATWKETPPCLYFGQSSQTYYLQLMLCPAFPEQHFWNMFYFSKLWFVQSNYSSKETTSLTVFLMWPWAVTSLALRLRLAGIFWETTLCWWRDFPCAISVLQAALRGVCGRTGAVSSINEDTSIYSIFIPEFVKVKWGKNSLKVRELAILVMRIEYFHQSSSESPQDSV